MINVGIVSAKENVAFNMASVVCKVGAHAERLDTYSFNKIKTYNIVILDLDNMGNEKDTIKNTSAGFNDIIVAGFSRSQEILDDFRPLMSVYLKPFKKDHILSFIEDLKHLVKDDCVVNNEENPIYTPTGNNTLEQDVFNTDVFSNEEFSLKLSKVINENYNGPSEKEFLKSIQLDDIVVTESVPMVVDIKKPREVDFTEDFINDALLMYRAQKLRKLRLSPNEIKDRVRALMMYDASRGANQQNIKSDTLAVKFEQSKKINDEIAKNEHATTDFEEVELKIEDQRSEKIDDQDDEVDYIDMPSPNAQNQNFDNYNESELKYIKQSPTTGSRIVEKTVPKSTNVLPATGDKKIILDKAELSKKMQGTMSPEQIEKLRKLGVKI